MVFTVNCPTLAAPTGGSAATAAKGVALVTLGWCHSSDGTPSVSLCSTAPPPGSRGPCCPLWGKCRVSGKGGVVGNFGLVPFNEQHPLSQPLRAASSPTGEPRPLLPPLGVVRRAANQDSNDFRWQSYLCFVPRQRQRGCSRYF